MSVREFQSALVHSDLHKNDLQWFPKWVTRYVEFLKAPTDSRLTLSQESALSFSRELLSNGTPAWQRMQALRSLESYRDLVLKQPEPFLKGMIRKLNSLADQEKAFGPHSLPDRDTERAMIGPIDPDESIVIPHSRRELRRQGKALPTERAYKAGETVCPTLKRASCRCTASTLRRGDRVL